MSHSAATLDSSLELDLDDFFENGTIGLHLVGRDGTILRANRADFEPLGYSADEYIGQPITRFHADPDTIEDILRRLSAGEKLDKYPARLRAKDGSIRHVHISSSVCFREGEFVNTRCFTVDVTDKVKAEEALRDAQERLATTFETALAGIAEVDSEGRFLRVNEAFSRITGYGRDELLELDIFRITHPDDEPKERRHFARQVAGDAGQYLDEKRCVTKDGRLIWVEVLSATVPNGEGGFGYGVRTIVDVTERKLAEEQKKLLLDELNHRVKNTLATVQALAAHTARNATSAEDFRRRFEPRLLALSAAHDRLTQNDWRGCSLVDIVTGELSAHGAEAPRLSARGRDLILPPRACLSLSMALHELATNAAKYGALSVPDGRIDVRWSVADDPSRPETLNLEWAESGGPPVAEPDSEGFGSRLLRVTAAELGGEMETAFAPAGFRWKLSMPLADRESVASGAAG
ncbi:MAG TPA: PAS domain S-box protein [Allosphingosinicella sp.]|nr:PAS domain S-box protein [Allosphingosinicella sp.]